MKTTYTVCCGDRARFPHSKHLYLLPKTTVSLFVSITATIPHMRMMEYVHGIIGRGSPHVVVVLNMEITPKVLGPEEGKQNDIGVDAGHELSPR